MSRHWLVRASAMLVLLFGLVPAAVAAPSLVANEVKNFKSKGSQDGFIREYGETANVGGSKYPDSLYLLVGDAFIDRQYRSILSFDTSGLPDDAMVTRAILRVYWDSTEGENPFSSLGYIIVNVKDGFFGASPDLELVDWESSPDVNAGRIYDNPVDNWYKSTIFNEAEPYINLTGLTQIRLQFQAGDNDNGDGDFLRFRSGDDSTKSLRPNLRVEYKVP